MAMMAATSSGSTSNSSSSSSSPCGACKFLRRKCVASECVFAPYFPSDEPLKFANAHKIFGASNMAKILNELHPSQREAAVSSLSYEAEARIKDPVYGCVGAISYLKRHIHLLEQELRLARSELSRYMGGGSSSDNSLSHSHPPPSAIANYVYPHLPHHSQAFITPDHHPPFLLPPSSSSDNHHYLNHSYSHSHTTNNNINDPSPPNNVNNILAVVSPPRPPHLVDHFWLLPNPNTTTANHPSPAVQADHRSQYYSKSTSTSSYDSAEFIGNMESMQLVRASAAAQQYYRAPAIAAAATATTMVSHHGNLDIVEPGRSTSSGGGDGTASNISTLSSSDP